jgi:ribosome maturation factor RimP
LELFLADDAQLTRLIEPVVTGLGFELVRVAMLGGRGAQSLQVMAEDPKTGQLTLDQCARISRALSDMLDEADPIEDEYRLEVSSPGIDRPLTRAKDWTGWVGHEAKVTYAAPVEGRKRFAGTIVGLEGAHAVLDVPELGEVRLPLAGMQVAKLTLTDKLIAATRPLSAEGADSVEETEDEED